MSELVNDCLVHYNSQHIQVRKDFFDLCAYDKSQYNTKTNVSGNIIRDEPNQECMAKILRVIETLTNTARSNWYLKAVNARKQGSNVPPEPPEHLIPLAYSAICHLLYDTYGESTVRNSVAALIQKRYIKRYQQNTGSIPCYALNIQTLQEALCQQAQDQTQNSLLNSTPILKKRGRPSKNEELGVENAELPVENNTQRGLNSTPPPVENNTNNIRDKKEVNNKKERDAASSTPQTDSLSFSQKSSSLLDQLTDEQSDCWTRCQALTGAQNLTQKAYESIVTLSSKVTTTTDLQSLYDYATDRGEEIAKAAGRKATLPNVGTMAHFLPEWEKVQDRKRAEKEQEQAAHTHVAGTGKLTNWTQARMAGTLPPVSYESLPTVKPASGMSQAGNISAGLQERIRQARERRAHQS